MKKLVSVVVPVYNEEAGIDGFLKNELVPALERLDGYQAEVILVDDGSCDGTLGKLNELCDEMNDDGASGDKRERGGGSNGNGSGNDNDNDNGEHKNNVVMRVVKLTRNFGKEVALSAGMDFAQGNAVVLIDADGQHPAEMIPEMVAKWEQGAAVVTAVRAQNTTKHRLSSKIYYQIIRMMGNKSVMEGELDFRLMDRRVVDEFKKMPEHNRMTRGLIDWLGFSQEYVKVRTRGRMSGKPTYSRRKLMQIASDSMVSMSRTPLMIFGYIGMFIMVASTILGLFILIQQYIMGDPLGLDWSGAVAMSVFVSFLVGLVLVSQAITALYIAQIHAEAKGRPLYVVDYEKCQGIDDTRGGCSSADDKKTRDGGFRVDKKDKV